jgi:hypothetical protein
MTMVTCTDGKVACHKCLNAYNSTIHCGLEHNVRCIEPTCRFYAGEKTNPMPFEYACRCGGKGYIESKQHGNTSERNYYILCKQCGTKGQGPNGEREEMVQAWLKAQGEQA